MKVHLDTDFGGDPDDACALVMLLGWPQVDIVGVTTNLDIDGRRAGCLSHYLWLAGRSDIPVAAGAAASLTTLVRYESTWADARYWPDPVKPSPSPPGAALALLTQSIEADATVIAIGAFTNLAILEVMRPGSLDRARVVATGGWIDPPAADLPQWGPAMDFNIQCDTRAAEIVAASTADLTLVQLPAAMRAQLRARDLDRLRGAGPMGELLAAQSMAHAVDNDVSGLANRHDGLPDDLMNFHWDPVTGAVAVGWSGADITERQLRADREGTILRFSPDPGGRRTKVVTGIDAVVFADDWLRAVEAAHRHQPLGARHFEPGF